jgi:hypothetical protein
VHTRKCDRGITEDVGEAQPYDVTTDGDAQYLAQRAAAQAGGGAMLRGSVSCCDGAQDATNAALRSALVRWGGANKPPARAQPRCKLWRVYGSQNRRRRCLRRSRPQLAANFEISNPELVRRISGVEQQ